MRRYCTVAVALGFAFALPATAHAAPFTVAAPTDAALRAAFEAANDAPGPDEVLLAGHTVVLTDGDLDVLDDLTLRGPGVIDGSRLESDAILEVWEPLTIDGVGLVNSNEDRAVLVLAPVDVRVERSQFASNEAGAVGFYPEVAAQALRAADASLTVSDSTFEGNFARNGGAIDVAPGSQLDVAVTVARSTFAGNRAVSDGEGSARGGAINIWDGVLTVENSTFSGNRVNGPSSSSGGGAIAVGNGAAATLTHVTITGNLAEDRAVGGGIAGPRFETVGFAKGLSFVPVMVSNSIVAGNTSEEPEGDFAVAAMQTDDCDLSVGTNGGNLEGGTTCGFRDARDKQNADPKLAALAANGGPTRTHALAADSPAVNMAVAGRCLASDQRSIPRVAAACDSGAYELVPAGTQPTQQPAAGGALGEQASSCLSVRRFKIRLRVPRGEEVRKATVVLNGERIRVKRGKRLTAIIDLRGLTKKRYKVKITLHLKGGGKVSGVRRYWTCTPAIRWTKPPKV
jgi:hypothetical protein